MRPYFGSSRARALRYRLNEPAVHNDTAEPNGLTPYEIRMMRRLAGVQLVLLKGSDAKRIRTLRDALSDVRHPAWLALPADYRIAGQDTLRILA